MMGTIVGMAVGLGITYGAKALGLRFAPENAAPFVVGGWLIGAAVAVGIAQWFSSGDPRPALFAGGFVYLATLQALFTAPHPVWAMVVGGLGVPIAAVTVWWFTRTRWEDE
jgi:hypothetical protein